ncbi:glycoside hydrolase family 9 protein [Rhodoferax aquaticus]|nr:glycoside hydrolase family 9 protein [Rhodoferax aquaticus]
MPSYHIRALSIKATGALLGVLSLLAQAAPALTTPHIKVDQFGYLASSKKVAVVANPVRGSNAGTPYLPGSGAQQFQVRRWADNAVVLSGTLSVWNGGAVHTQSGDQGWWFDFSALTTPGTYYVFDTLNQVGSHPFEVGNQVYDKVLKQAGRMFFYQRANFAKQVPYAEVAWADAAAYNGANQDRYARNHLSKGDASTARDLRGGWMDAGDTNKYTTFAEAAVLQLLEAYRLSPSAFKDDWNIPESGNGVPDLLDEVRWELDFLQRMQDATGTNGLFLKVGLDTYSGDVAPVSQDTRPRYYVGECTSSTLSGAAMFAAAHSTYKALPSQGAYAVNLLTRAEAAWARAKVTTRSFTSFQSSCDNNDIKSGNADRSAQDQRASAVVAAAYLFEATGKPEYSAFVDANYRSVQPLSDGWWGPYTQVTETALLRYAKLPSATAATKADLLAAKKNSQVFSLAEQTASTDLYQAYVADPEFGWGHNARRANVGSGNLNNVSFGINPDQSSQYVRLAEQHLHWLHGANPLGLVMLSNMGASGAENSVRQIYHQAYADGTAWDDAKTSQYGPAPGYLVGGPNKNYSGPRSDIRNQPPQKAYVDWNTSADKAWEISEPAIYYQSAYLLLLSRLMVPAPVPPPTVRETVVYGDALAASWSDWSWDVTSNYKTTSPKKEGSYALRAAYKPWGGVSLRAANAIALSSPNAGLALWAYSAKAMSINVYTQSSDSGVSSPAKVVALAANAWTEVRLSRGEIGQASIKRITLQNNAGSANVVIYDQLRITE